MGVCEKFKEQPLAGFSESSANSLEFLKKLWLNAPGWTDLTSAFSNVASRVQLLKRWKEFAPHLALCPSG